MEAQNSPEPSWMQKLTLAAMLKLLFRLSLLVPLFVLLAGLVAALLGWVMMVLFL